MNDDMSNKQGLSQRVTSDAAYLNYLNYLR